MIYKFAPYSFSKIATHNGCNRKFKYAVIDKAPKSKRDDEPLIKGGAVHSILENFPNATSHKFAKRYFHIAEKFIKSELGNKYIFKDAIKEYSFGISKDLKPTTYKDKDALFRGFIDYVGKVDEQFEEIIEIETLDDIPDGYEIIEILSE